MAQSLCFPATFPLPAQPGCPRRTPAETRRHKRIWGETDFRLAAAAYDHPKACYDREYLFQWAEMDPNIHKTALAQVTALGSCTAGAAGCSLEVPTEPYHPAYFLINGRSMPDLMDANFAAEYPHQPYNGNPHMHPGELTLIRAIGQGRWQHPFHEHANHVRILARDGNMVLAPDGTDLAGQLMFNTDTTPGEAFDGIFYFTGRGLNWDPYGHHPDDYERPERLTFLYTGCQRLQHRQRPRRSTISSGARTTISRSKLLPSAMWPPAVQRRCRIPTFSRTAPGMAVLRI